MMSWSGRIQEREIGRRGRRRIMQEYNRVQVQVQTRKVRDG